MESTQHPVHYQFGPGLRSVLAEIYLPKKMATQGTVFGTLKDGLEPENVRNYLVANVEQIRDELNIYPHWFNPNLYGAVGEYATPLEEAVARMNMVGQVFYGCSMTEVDGVFLNTDLKSGYKRVDEERAQIIRLLFKFSNKELEQKAENAKCGDVYRVIISWALSLYSHADADVSWGEVDRDRFLVWHQKWSEEKKRFAHELYPILVPAIAKWVADCGLFIFGYLVRKFWIRIAELHAIENIPLEDEIWVTSIFHMDINVLKPKD